MLFMDKYFYLFSFLVVLIAFLAIIIFKKNKWVITYSNGIALTLAALQGIFFFIFMIKNMILLAWQSSMLQDLCPLAQFVSIIFFIMHKEKLYKALMPWLIIGAAVTMLGDEIDIASDPMRIITYGQHTTMLVQGFFSYLVISPYQKKDYQELMIFPVVLIIWNLFVGLIPWQVTGNDLWGYSSTALLPPALVESSPYAILGNLSIPYPIPTLIFYALAVGSAYLLAWSVKYAVQYQVKTIQKSKKLIS